MNEISVKTVLNKHRRDEWFLDDYSVNPYTLCDFNCRYCYIRGSKYGGETFAAKVNAPVVLQKELRRESRKGRYGFIALSSATEPWMNAERKYELTRKCLEVIAAFRFPVHCLTKSDLILRDVELLEEVERRAILPEDLKDLRGVLVTFSISTLDSKIAKIMEPGAPSPRKRMETLWDVREMGFYAGIAYIPVLPFISDSEEQLEEMARMARDLNADYVFFGDLTITDHFLSFLERYFQELVEKYRSVYPGNYASRFYRNRFYKKVKEMCEKYGVRLGIRPISSFS